MTVATSLRRILNRLDAILKEAQYDELLSDLEEIVDMLDDGASGIDQLEES